MQLTVSLQQSTYGIHWTWSQCYGWAFQNTCQKDEAIRCYLLEKENKTDKNTVYNPFIFQTEHVLEVVQMFHSVRKQGR